VNTIKAVPDADGTVHIHAIGAGVPEDSNEPNDHKHYEKLTHTNVQINGSAVAGGLNDVCNALNELFTVGAFEQVVISDPYSTLVADVDGTLTTGSIVGSHGVDPIGDDIFGASQTGSLNGYKTVETIDQAGEYFTFDIRNEGQLGFGLVISDACYAAGNYASGSSSSYINPATFGTSNSAHYGFQWSHWFHPTPNGSWTNYGAKTGYVMGPAWSNSNVHFEARDEWLAGTPIKVRCGIDENGYIHVSTLADDGVTWKLHARSNYPVPEGFEAHLGIKMGSTAPRLYTQPKVHLLEPAAPVMNFRFIESPDGYYSFPLFATEEEADYYEEQVAGSNNGSHTHVYPDDPSQTTWYMPNTSHQMNYGLTPVEDGVTTFLGNAINWTEITSLTNADLAPSAYTDATITVDENSSVNIQTQPADTAYTTTMTGLPLGLFHLGDGTIIGTAPEVTGDNVANPNDDYAVTVTRTNNYGSSNGTLTIRVNNLTAPVVTPIAGVTHEGGTALIDADTMDAGSVISIDDVVEAGNRVVLDKEWLDNYVLPAITSGSGSKSVWVGFVAQGVTPDYSSISNADFRIAYEFNCDDASRANNNWRLKTHGQGSSYANVGIGSLTSGLYDYVFINEGTHVRAGGLVASQGHDASTKVFEPNDAAWNWTLYNTSDGASQDLIIATQNTQLDISLSEFNEYAEPSAPTTLTNWSKAIDFDGSAERMQQVDSSYYRVPMKMNGLNNQVAGGSKTVTSSDLYARPWATAIVFKSTTYNSNQHVWNVGEGTGTTDDNIYLRRDANRDLWFGMGRSGDMVECYIGSIANNIGGWHAVYIAHSGARFGEGNTAAELENAFDFRYTSAENNWAVGTNQSTQANWNSGTVGGRMNRSYDGDFTIGGRGANRSFRGKIASFVSTTLRRNAAMPADAEIFEMITDPMSWLNNYKVGNQFRLPWSAGDLNNFSLNDGSSSYSTQVWLMGDGTSDSYSNMIRNQVFPSDQNYTKMNMISMVSNDIQNVTINGLI
jgi:hypothetical protein